MTSIGDENTTKTFLLHTHKQNLKFGKRIRYETRKALAESRPRVRGQFVKVAPADDTATNGTSAEPSAEPSANTTPPTRAGNTNGHSRLRPQGASMEERGAAEALAAIQGNSPRDDGGDDNLDAEAVAVEEQDEQFEDHADTRVPVEGAGEAPAPVPEKKSRSVQGSAAPAAYGMDSTQGGKLQGSNGGRRSGSDSGSNSPDRGV